MKIFIYVFRIENIRYLGDIFILDRTLDVFRRYKSIKNYIKCA